MKIKFPEGEGVGFPIEDRLFYPWQKSSEEEIKPVPKLGGWECRCIVGEDEEGVVHTLNDSDILECPRCSMKKGEKE